MTRDMKIIRFRDRELGEHTFVVSKSWGRFPEVWDVLHRFDASDNGIQRAHDWIVEATGRQAALRDNGL